MSSLSFKPGDIAIIDLPFSSYSDSKIRPVLVLSSSSYNKDDIIVAKITSSFFHTGWELLLSQKDLKEGKLRKQSYIDVGFLFTVERSITIKKIGEISSNKLKEVREKLADLFSL